jgi:hypothetical protein
MAAAAVILIGAALMAYYNHRVFGDALTLPYQVNRATYASAPVFLWQSPRPLPEYRHKVMHDFYALWELGDFRYARTLRGFASVTAQKMATGTLFFFGLALLAPWVMLGRVFRDRRVRFLMAAAAVFAAGLCMNAWFFPHYAAPLTGAVYVLLLQCMRHLRQWRPGGAPLGRAMIRNAMLACVALAGIRVCATPLRLAIPRWPAMWYGTEPLGLPRAKIAAELKSMPGKQLAIVRYVPDHPPFDDWVYNPADIDASKVVWAREMDARNNRKLLEYFHDRRAWLVEPDFDPPRVSPYIMSPYGEAREESRTKMTETESEYVSRQPGR